MAFLHSFGTVALVILYGALAGPNVPYRLFAGCLRNFTLRTNMVYHFCGLSQFRPMKKRFLAPWNSLTQTLPWENSSPRSQRHFHWRRSKKHIATWSQPTVGASIPGQVFRSHPSPPRSRGFWPTIAGIQHVFRPKSCWDCWRLAQTNPSVTSVFRRILRAPGRHWLSGNCKRCRCRSALEPDFCIGRNR
jgi:hypothetical protein